MQRDIFTSDHEAFRDTVRSFIAKEVAPYHEQWERDGMVSREVWLAAGQAGLLGIDMDEQYGGGGNDDYRYYLVLNEEMARAGAHGPGFSVHNDINGQYFRRLMTAGAGASAGCPGYCSGELITAIAMSEPGAGSDLQGIRTTAVEGRGHLHSQRAEDVHLQRPASRPGDRRGQDRPRRRAPGHQPARGRARHGGVRARHATSTRSACTRRTPRNCSSATYGFLPENLLGEEGGGFIALMQNLPRERVAIGTAALAGAEAVFEDDAGVLQAAAGVRPADRQVPAQQVRARRDGDRAGRGPGVHRQGGASSTTRGGCPTRTPRW